MQTNRGFALATAMMVLALLSVLGTAALQSATLEVQVFAHDRDGAAHPILTVMGCDTDGGPFPAVGGRGGT